MEITPLGDSALVVRVRERFEDAPEETLDEVIRAFQRIRNAAIPGVIELAPCLYQRGSFLRSDYCRQSERNTRRSCSIGL